MFRICLVMLCIISPSKLLFAQCGEPHTKVIHGHKAFLRFLEQNQGFEGTCIRKELSRLGTSVNPLRIQVGNLEFRPEMEDVFFHYDPSCRYNPIGHGFDYDLKIEAVLLDPGLNVYLPPLDINCGSYVSYLEAPRPGPR